MMSEATVHTGIGPSSFSGVPRGEPWSADLVGGARNRFPSTGVVESLSLVVRLARQTFGADGAGILLTTDGATGSAAASGAHSKEADTLQVDLHQGPAFRAVSGRHPVISSDLRYDSRWRFWAPKAADLGIRSVLSLALADGEPFGAVTLYSQRPSFFNTASLAPGLRFAQHASIAITLGVEQEQLLRAADTRGIIGQAQGILMERYHITADQAFALIRRSSTALNQKVRSVADRVIGGRSLDDIDLLALATPAGGHR